MRWFLPLAFTLAILAPAWGDDDEAAKAAVAVELAKLKLRPAPAPSPVGPAPTVPVRPTTSQRLTTSTGSVIELHEDGVWRYASEQQFGAPGVAPAKTFRTGSFPTDHRCPNCGHQSASGTGTWIIRGWNRDGTHNHTCPKCGYTGSH